MAVEGLKIWKPANFHGSSIHENWIFSIQALGGSPEDPKASLVPWAPHTSKMWVKKIRSPHLDVQAPRIVSGLESIIFILYILYYVILYVILFYYIMLYHIISYYIILYYIVLYPYIYIYMPYNPIYHPIYHRGSSSDIPGPSGAAAAIAGIAAGLWANV